MLCFCRFSMIQTWRYLYSSNLSPQWLRVSNPSAIDNRKSISQNTTRLQSTNLNQIDQRSPKSRPRARSGPRRVPIRPASFPGMFNILTISCKWINAGFLKVFQGHESGPQTEKIIIGCLSEKIRSLESDKSGP